MVGAAPEIVTFGCRLNIVESETMQRHAANAGLRNTIIVNTCAVTAEAERQAGQAIRRLRRERPGAKLIVTGCAAHITPEKYRGMKEVDHVIANDVKLRAESFQAIADQGPGARVDMAALDPGLRRDGDPLIAVPAMQRAFVQVQNGCDHRCTFCIIPFGRGVSRSLTADEVIAQLRARVAEGFQEIVLTGVDIASYGHDLAERPTLGAMMRRVLAAVPALPRLRLSSLDPAAIDEDLWDLIAHEPRLMPHLHLSLQAGDDMVLKRMKRRHSRDDVRRLCDRARMARPDIVFGADIIAGFPTETDAMFENTCDLVAQTGMTWLHVFPYSSRKGTPAARMPQVHGDARKIRAERLRLLGEVAAAEHHRGLIGKNFKVLVEKNGVGCTPHFAKLKIKGHAVVGRIVDARGVAMEKDDVFAEITGAA